MNLRAFDCFGLYLSTNNFEGQDGMRPGGYLIHFGLCDCSLFEALHEFVDHFLFQLYFGFGDVVEVKAEC